MEPFKLTIDFKLETSRVDARPLKLTDEWTCELKQKLQMWFGSRHVWKIWRCEDNACRVTGRRRRYWLRQAYRYANMKRD